MADPYADCNFDDDNNLEDNDEEIGALGSILGGWDDDDDAVVGAAVAATSSALDLREEAAAAAAMDVGGDRHQPLHCQADLNAAFLPQLAAMKTDSSGQLAAPSQLTGNTGGPNLNLGGLMNPQDLSQSQTEGRAAQQEHQQQQRQHQHQQSHPGSMSQPGLNLPITHSGQVLGTVGGGQAPGGFVLYANPQHPQPMFQRLPGGAIPASLPPGLQGMQLAHAPQQYGFVTAQGVPQIHVVPQQSGQPTNLQQQQQTFQVQTPQRQLQQQQIHSSSQGQLGQLQQQQVGGHLSLQQQQQMQIAMPQMPVVATGQEGGPPAASTPIATPVLSAPNLGAPPSQTPQPSRNENQKLQSTQSVPVVSCSDTDGEAASSSVASVSGASNIGPQTKRARVGEKETLKSEVKKTGKGPATSALEASAKAAGVAKKDDTGADTGPASQEDRAKANRDRNREHARNTRLRKKAYLERLKSTVDELCRERDNLVSERAGAASLLVEMHNTRTDVLRSFLALRAANEKRRDLWSSILDESCFTCVIPVTPYRSFPASEVQVSKCQRTILGVDGMMSDSASLFVLVNSLVDRRRFPDASIQFKYTLVAEDAVVAGNQMMARWVMTTVNAVQCGARMEISKHGMLCCKFNSAHKIVGLELMFDVMAFMLQLKQSTGSDTFAVIPNTVQTCQRPFDSPMVMTLAERPYTIVQVNTLWEEMTGWKAEDVVGKKSCRILQGQETDSNSVEVLVSSIRYKRPAYAAFTNYTRFGSKFKHYLNVYPLSTDSKITHYLGITAHSEVMEVGGLAMLQEGMPVPQAHSPALMAKTPQPTVPLAVMSSGPLGAVSQVLPQGTPLGQGANSPSHGASHQPHPGMMQAALHTGDTNHDQQLLHLPGTSGLLAHSAPGTTVKMAMPSPGGGPIGVPPNLPNSPTTHAASPPHAHLPT